MHDAARGLAQVHGGQLYFEDSRGDGPPLFLVHGFASDQSSWDAVAAPWARAFRLVRYDLRGHGRSSVPAPGAAYSHAADLAALLDHLGIGRAHVAGVSMGGAIATHFALTHPERVDRLVLVSPALVGWEWSPEWKARWSDVVGVARSRGVEAARARWLEHPLFEPARGQPGGVERVRAMLAAYSGWHWLHRDGQQYALPADMERLAQLRAPTLLVSGEQDLADFRDIASVLEDQLPDLRVLRLPAVGHLPNLEAPGVLERAVREFLLLRA